MTTASDRIPVWLVSHGHVLSAAELAVTRRDRRKGLRGSKPTHEALVIENCRWVHSIGMRYPIDVAFLDSSHRVIATRRLKPWRVDRPVKNAVCVVEAQAGALERWALSLGDVVEVRHVNQ